MNYYVKERLFSIGSKFDVYDEGNNVAYLVEADKFDFGKNIYIYTPNKEEKLLYLEQKLRIGAHKYEIFDKNGASIAMVEKELLVPHYKVSGVFGNFEMKSDALFMARNYNVTKDGYVIGRINKEWTFGRDRYNLEVIDNEYTVFLLGMLIIVDMVRYHSDN